MSHSDPFQRGNAEFLGFGAYWSNTTEHKGQKVHPAYKMATYWHLEGAIL